MIKKVLVELVYQQSFAFDVPNDNYDTEKLLINMYKANPESFLSNAKFCYFNYSDVDENGDTPSWKDVMPAV